MYKVFICEDNQPLAKVMADFIQGHILVADHYAEIAMVTSTPNEILAFLKQQPDTKGMYFLDIDLGDAGMDGIELARQIRAIDGIGKIIFVTTHENYAPLTFRAKVEAIDFIVKDGNTSNLKAAISEVIQTIFDREHLSAKAKEQITINRNGLKTYVDVADILFFETSGTPHLLHLFTKHKRFSFYGTIKEVLTWNPKFQQIHKARIVNQETIDTIDKRKRLIHFINGSTCAYSPRMLKIK